MQPKKLLLFPIILFSLFIQAQQTTTVKVPPNKDTVLVKFTTTTVTSANTSTSYITSIITSGGVTPPPDTTGTGGNIGCNGCTLIYKNDYDNYSDLSLDQLGKGTISNTIVKNGGGSFKSLVTAGEGQISGGYRSEQSYPKSFTPPNTPLVIEYDEYFESIGTKGLSGQLHGDISGTSGPGSIWLDGNSVYVQRNNIGTAGSSNIYGSPFVIQTGKWYHVRWEIFMTTSNSGYWRVWFDTTKIYGIENTKTTAENTFYFKPGQNLFSSPPKDRVVYIDNLRIWKQ